MTMGVGEIITGILMLIFSIVIVAVVLFQQGRASGISGVIAGGADTFFDKNKARTIDTFLAKATKFFAIGFFVLTIVANIIVALQSK